MATNRSRAGWIGLVVATICAVWVFLQSRQTMYTYIFDDWGYIARSTGATLATALQDHNGHLSVIPRMTYLAVLRTGGLPAQNVFNWIAIAGHLAAIVAVGEVLRRRHGRVVCYMVSVGLAMSGLGAEIWLWGTNIGFSSSMLFLVLAVLCLDEATSTGSLRWRFGVLCALTLSVSSSGAGVAGLVVFMMVVLVRSTRRAMWWTVAVPFTAYLAWFAMNGEVVEVPHPSLWHAARFVVEGMAWSAASVFGVGIVWGYVFMLGLAALMVASLRAREMDIRRYLWPMFLAVFWAMTAYGRGWFGQSNVSRYRWVGAIAFVLAVADLVPRRSFRRGMVAMGTTVACCLVVVSVIRTDAMTRSVAEFYDGVQSTAIVRDSVALHMKPQLRGDTAIHKTWNQTTVTADQFFRAVDEFGEPPTLPATRFGSVLSGSVADRALSDFGYFDAALVPDSRRCLSAVDVPTLTVPEGGAVRIRTKESRMAVFTMFMDPGNRQDFNVRTVEAGSYEVVPRANGWGRPITVTFVDGTIERCGDGEG